MFFFYFSLLWFFLYCVFLWQYRVSSFRFKQRRPPTKRSINLIFEVDSSTGYREMGPFLNDLSWRYTQKILSLIFAVIDQLFFTITGSNHNVSYVLEFGLGVPYGFSHGFDDPRPASTTSRAIGSLLFGLITTTTTTILTIFYP